MERKLGHRLLSMVLSLLMILSLVPTTAFAADESGAVSAVAKVGDLEYETLAAAIKAAAAGDTVTLLADTTEDITIDKNLTLDLGGKTLTNTGAGKATVSVTGGTAAVKNGNVTGGVSYYNIEVTKGSNANLILDGVTAAAGNTGSSMIDNWGTLTIDSGTYTGGMNTVKSEEGSTLVINGGTFTCDYGAKWSYTGVILVYGDTTINGGTFIQKTTNTSSYAQVVLTGVVDGYTATTKITGGTFKNEKLSGIFRGIGKATSSNFKVSGGTFNKYVPDSYFEDGYIPVQNEDGTYGVKKGKFVAAVGSVGYESLDDAIAAANASVHNKTVYLREDLTVDHQIVIENAKSKKITLDLGGFSLTSTYAMGNASGAGRYALVNNTALEIKNGTFAAGQARAIGAYGALTLNGAKVTTQLTDGNACVALCANGAAYTVKNTTIDGAYALSIFANNATVTVTGSTLTGNGNVLYHNGTNYGLKLTVSDTTIASSGSCGVYISGSTGAQAADDNQNGKGGFQQATFTNCTISGTNGVEVKYTDATLENCDVTSTVDEPSYVQNSNGPAGKGFAVVSTDNATHDTTPAPKGTVTIIGASGKYTGLVGLGALDSVKTTYADFVDETIKVSGGTFSSAVKPEYCADGFIPTENDDGTHTVKAYKPVEVWTGYSGSRVEGYSSVAEAAANLGANKWIVIAEDYTLTENFTIPTGVYLDVAAGATLTVDSGVTVTVAADAKRLGVRTGAVLVNNGTILVCGTSYSYGFVMVQKGGTFDAATLSVPDGYFLDNNGSNYFATENSKAIYEITFEDGTVKLTADSTNIKGGNVRQIKLLADVTTGGWTLDSRAGSDVTLDLNGHTLSYSGANPYYATLNIYTKLTVKNGTIRYDGTSRGAIDLLGQGNLTVAEDAVIDGGESYGIFTSGTSKLTVYGTVKANGHYAIAGNGSKDAGGSIDDCDVTVEAGAQISAPNGIGIYHPELGTATVNGGTINAHTGVELCAGKLVVNGGSITSTGANWDATGSQNAILDGAAISLINRNYPGGVPTAEIYGGTFKATGDGAQAVRAYDYTNNEVAEWADAGDSVNVFGGLFSSEVRFAWCAEGYIPATNDDGTHTVKMGHYVAKVDDTYYEDINVALTAWAADGGTLKLLDDCTTEAGQSGAWNVDVQKAATLDLNGHTLTLGTSKYIKASADLTIDDTVGGGKLVGTYFYVIQGLWSGTVTVNGGEISNAVKGVITTNGAFVMNGGKLIGAEGSYGLSTSKTVTVNGGEINTVMLNYGADTATFGTVGGDYRNVTIGTLRVYNGNITINFNSGLIDTFSTTYSPTLNTTENAYFGSTFTKGLPAGKLLKSVEKDGQIYYQVFDLTEADAVAKVIAADGTVTLYADAAVAAAAVKAGGTLILLKDHSGDTLRVQPGAGSVTIDLNGKTVTNANGPALYVNVNGNPDDTTPYTVTVKNGTLVSANTVALRVSSTNNAANIVTEDLTLTPADGNVAIELQDSARLVFTDEAAVTELVGNGYAVTLDGVKYVYGVNGGFVYAVKALPAEGGIVKLLADYTGTQKLAYTDTTGKPVILDLNGKTYNYTYANGIEALEFSSPNANLTIKNGTLISAGSYGIYAVLTPNYPASSANDLKLTLDGVTLKAINGNGIGINGTLTGNVTTIRNSTIEAADTGIYYPTNGTLTIENSKISGGKLGVAIKGGSVNISGDETDIRATAEEKVPTDYYTGGTGGILAEGYALYVEGGYAYDIALNITGGTFTSKGDAVKMYVKDGDTSATRTITVSGGTFSSDVQPAYCAENYKSIANGDGTYTVKRLVLTVVVKSEPAGAGVLVGGGAYADGETATISATAADGYTFLGWYDGDTLITKDATYTVPAGTTGTVTYTAKYVGNAKQKLTVNVGSGTVKAEYGSVTRTWKTSQKNIPFQKGTYFTLTAAANEGFEFLYWVNQDDRIVCTDATYSFYLGDDKTVTAVYREITPDDPYVIVRDMNDKIISRGYAYDGVFAVPERLGFEGYEFVGWFDEAGNEYVPNDGQFTITESVTILARYEMVAGTYTVTAAVGEETTTNSYKYGTVATVKAPETSGELFFEGWYCGERLVSTASDYSFIVTGDVTLTAKYGAASVDREPTVSMNMGERKTNENGKTVIVMDVSWDVPDGYTFVEGGLLRTLDESKKNSLTLGNVDGNTIKKNVATSTGASATYSYTLTLGAVSSAKTLYAVGYIICRNNETGEMMTVYTNLFTSAPAQG